jgi:hypothetical protein
MNTVQDKLDYEYVNSHWSDYCPMTYGRMDICDMEGEMNYAAARKFTDERLEEIRQVKEEIKELVKVRDMYFDVVIDLINEVDGIEFVDCEWDSFYDLCLNSRILGRQLSVLAELQRGMK